MRFAKNFPTPHHIKEFCNPEQGEDTCKYLNYGAGYFCAKGTSHGFLVEEMNGIAAKGDNCEGIIPFLCRKLIGKKVTLRETSPIMHEIKGTCEELSVKDGTLILKLKTRFKKEEDSVLAINFLDIDRRDNKIIISCAFLGGPSWIFVD